MALNSAQKKMLEVYASGDFAHLIEEVAKGTDAIALSRDLGDGLLTFLLIELSNNEDCDSDETALDRLRTVVRDCEAIIQAISPGALS